MTDRANFACNPETSRGRLYGEPAGNLRGPRNIFQRDRDRIIHSISFRRLRHKTQVFILPDGDHYRVRLTHSLEVAQIGRTIARALGLDEDLTEALCLAHDIGHPPFGHAGEDALKQVLQPYGGFDHNAHTLRALMMLDSPYPLWPGLNLSWDLLEGLAKHNGPVLHPGWALVQANAAFDLNLPKWPSLEAQVAAIADDIAYDNHDIDDGMRAGLLTLDQLLELDFVQLRWRDICARYPGARRETLLRELIREQIGVMVNDVIAQVRQNIADLGIETVDDIRGAGQIIANFSPLLSRQERQLKKFMYANLYHHSVQLTAAEQAAEVVTKLYGAYAADARLLPPQWRERLPSEMPEYARHIGDYIAGMTDRFAINQFAQIFGRSAVPGALQHV